MAKDPAFLFYPKDWLQGTSQMMPDEKGIYIDLLAHQHQNGAIPNDTKRLARMVGLSENDFLPIWETVKHKFNAAELNHLVNHKLRDVVNKRSSNSRTKKIAGSFAAVVRLSKAPQEIKEQIKKVFNINQFYDVTDEFLNQYLTSWFDCAWKSIATATVNGTENVLPVLESNVVTENGFAIYDAEQEVLKNQKEFERICMATGKDADFAKDSLHKYHLYLAEKEQYPKGRKAVFAGFEKWLLNEKKQTNGKQFSKTNQSVGRTIEFDKP